MTDRDETEVIRSLEDTKPQPIVQPPAVSGAPPVAEQVPPAPPGPAPAPKITIAEAAGWTGAQIRRRPLASVVVVALVVAIFAVLFTAPWRSDDAAPASRAGGQSGTRLTVTVTSIDPSGGSGFRRDGDTWRTQTYRSRTFGNLKDGVGLLLDLGSAQAVSSVAVPVVEGPLDIELRAGDSAATDGAAYTKVDPKASASGAVTFNGSTGGTHRYWLLWVTRLGSANRAVLGAPVVTGAS